MENDKLLNKKIHRNQEGCEEKNKISLVSYLIEQKQDKHRKNMNLVLTHFRGIPPSCNWLNKFSAILIDNFLLYISNNFIVIIETDKKEFKQLIFNSSGDNKEKFSALAKVNNHIFVACTYKGKFILYEKNESTHENTLNDNNLIRPIFKESSSFMFENINNSIKVLLYNDDYLLAGDIEGNIYHFILSINESSESKKACLYLLHIVSVGNKIQQITDGCLVNNNLLLTSSLGCIYEYLISEKVVNTIELQRKKTFIYSLEFLHFPPDLMIISTLDKDGTFSLFIKKGDKYTKYHEGKGVFNDRSIIEAYTFFVHKMFKSEKGDQFFCLISSNKGKLFYRLYNIQEILSFYSDSEEDNQNLILKINDFKELGENTHSMCIYNIVHKENEVICFSSDKTISIWKMPEFIFLHDIKTIGSKPKNIFYNEKNIYLLTEDNQIFQYYYKKVLLI